MTIETVETADRRSRSAMTDDRIQLASVSIRDFRNLERVDLDLQPDGVAIIGDNGHGKTNLLEAIYYLQILRSIRDARDQDLT
ncbi:MAG TPA: AAA family ATPase, partial [Gemmatimonadaceae bacterium]|nr:AAA family ATPase [Gemmatimonadaceae bacterium]